MIELSKAQQEALDRTPSDVLNLVDPRTQRQYVLVPAPRYEDMCAQLDADDDTAGIDSGRLLNEAMRQEDQDDPGLASYQKHKGEQ